ncbi:MAG: hypothetical protein ACI4LX_00790 [Treponema sp.]
MKRILGLALVSAVLAGGAFAQSISLTNTFGGDTDNISSNGEFISINKDGTKETTSSIGDRIQLDVSSEKLDARVRLDLAAPTFEFNEKNSEGKDISTKVDGKNATLRLRGYVDYKPWSWLHLNAGNNYFSKYGLKGAYLPVVDDYRVAGKLTGNSGASVIVDVAGLKVAANVAAVARLNLNFGASYNIADILDLSVVAQDVTEDTRVIAGYVGFTGVENLVANVGYIYNQGSDDNLPSTQHAVTAAVGYNFKDIGFAVYAEGAFGLNNVKGGGKETKYSKDGIPVHAGLLVKYIPVKDVTLNVRALANIKPTDDGTSWSIYPFADFGTTVGTIRVGARVKFTEDGYNGVEIPVSWKYKFKIM